MTENSWVCGDITCTTSPAPEPGVEKGNGQGGKQEWPGWRRRMSRVEKENVQVWKREMSRCGKGGMSRVEKGNVFAHSRRSVWVWSGIQEHTQG